MPNIGGIRPFQLFENGITIFEELSQSCESMRPLFIIPGKDTGREGQQRVREICFKLDTQAKYASVIPVDYNGVTYHVKMKYFLLFDGQMIEMTSGLNGANCTMCPATKDQIHDPESIKKGFKITNNITKINDLYYMLEKDDNGQIIRRKGGYRACISGVTSWSNNLQVNS